MKTDRMTNYARDLFESMCQQYFSDISPMSGLTALQAQQIDQTAREKLLV